MNNQKNDVFVNLKKVLQKDTFQIDQINWLKEKNLIKKIEINMLDIYNYRDTHNYKEKIFNLGILNDDEFNINNNLKKNDISSSSSSSSSNMYISSSLNKNKWKKNDKGMNNNNNNNRVEIKRSEMILKNLEYMENTNAWKPVLNNNNNNTSKKIKGILNKLSMDNYKKLIEETKNLNYNVEDISFLIFSKIIIDPQFCEIYTLYCLNLPNIHESLIKKIDDEFKNNNSKNLCIIISNFYNKGIIKNINGYINSLLTYTNEELSIEKREDDLMMLCSLLSTLNILEKTKFFQGSNNINKKYFSEIYSKLSLKSKVMLDKLLN